MHIPIISTSSPNKNHGKWLHSHGSTDQLFLSQPGRTDQWLDPSNQQWWSASSVAPRGGIIQQQLHTPWKVNSSPLKNGGWKTILSYWVLVIFQGRTVKLQGCISNGCCLLLPTSPIVIPPADQAWTKSSPPKAKTSAFLILGGGLLKASCQTFTGDCTWWLKQVCV